MKKYLSLVLLFSVSAVYSANRGIVRDVLILKGGMGVVQFAGAYSSEEKNRWAEQTERELRKIGGLGTLGLSTAAANGHAAPSDTPVSTSTPVPTPIAGSANGAASAPAKKQEVVEIHQRNS